MQYNGSESSEEEFFLMELENIFNQPELLKGDSGYNYLIERIE